MERTHELPSAERVSLLSLLRETSTRNGSRGVDPGQLLNGDDALAEDTNPATDIAKLQSSQATGSEEASEEELLSGMLVAQRDSAAGMVLVLSLVNVGLDFALDDLSEVITDQLQSLNLSRNKNLTGNLSQIAHCTALFDVCLEGTEVTGDLSSLARCDKLHKVMLSNLKVTGDIATFAHCPGLKKLWLRGTGVHGDISETFANTTLLVDVLCAKTRVHGMCASRVASSLLHVRHGAPRTPTRVAILISVGHR